MLCRAKFGKKLIKMTVQDNVFKILIPRNFIWDELEIFLLSYSIWSHLCMFFVLNLIKSVLENFKNIKPISVSPDDGDR
jgi:hypothetical protein